MNNIPNNVICKLNETNLDLTIEKERLKATIPYNIENGYVTFQIDIEESHVFVFRARAQRGQFGYFL